MAKQSSHENHKPLFFITTGEISTHAALEPHRKDTVHKNALSPSIFTVCCSHGDVPTN